MDRRHLQFAVALLVVASVAVVALTSGPTAARGSLSASPTPPEIADRDTFTVQIGSISPASSGRICANLITSDVNEVVVSDVELTDVTIWHEGDLATRVDISSAVTDRTVLYSNGENDLVTTLATLNGCIGIPQPKPITLEVYYMDTSSLDASGLRIQSGPGVADAVPEPQGLILGDVRDGSVTDGEDGAETDDPVSIPTPTDGSILDDPVTDEPTPTDAPTATPDDDDGLIDWLL